MRRFAIAIAAGVVLWAADSPNAVDLIKDEGLNRSQAINFLTYLSDGIGPRTTGSAGMERARDWAQSKLREIGLENIHTEGTGKAMLDWRVLRFSAQVIEPQFIPLTAYPKWHSPGVAGEVVGEVVTFDAKGLDDLEKYRGHLRGKMVLHGLAAQLKPSFEGRAGRRSEAELLEIANAPAWTPPILIPPTTPPRPPPTRMPWRPSVIQQFFRDEGVAASLQTSTAKGGTLFVDDWVAQEPASMLDDPAKSESGKEWAANAIPQLVVASEEYGRLRRMVEMGAKPRIALQMAVDYSAPKAQANLIAEILGTDLKDQIVMLGAHLDSWHVGTGATDNGAGVAICMEALRILRSLKLTPRRTVRVALWDSEEFAAKGSRVYVSEHFGHVVTTSPSSGAIPVRTLKRGPDYEKLSAYYNVDFGSGKIRGIYLEGNEQLRNIFREWMVPLRSLGTWTMSGDDGGGSDHLRFDQVGLPGLFFLQDDLYYEKVLHSTSDVLERAEPDDLKQAAVVMAVFVYQTAMRDERLPRRPVAIAVE